MEVYWRHSETFHIIIFNRWSNVVLESDELQKKWNGNIKNTTAEDGVYYYTLDYKTPCNRKKPDHERLFSPH